MRHCVALALCCAVQPMADAQDGDVRAVLRQDLAESVSGPAEPAQLRSAKGRIELIRVLGNARWTHGGGVDGLVALGDGRTVATVGGWDATIKFWDVESGRLTRVLRGHAESITGIAAARDRPYLLTSQIDLTIRLWDALEGREIRRVKGPGLSRAIAMSRDGGCCAAISAEGAAVWTLPDFKPQALPSKEHGWATRVFFRRSDRELILAGEGGRVEVVDARSLRRRLSLRGHRADVLAAALSEDESTLVTGDGAGTVRVWSLDGGQCLRVLEDLPGEISAVAADESMSYVVAATVSGDVGAWSIREDWRFWAFRSGAGGWWSAAFVPGSRMAVLSGLVGGIARVSFGVSGTPLFEDAAIRRVLHIKRVGEQGQALLARSDGSVSKWDVDAGEEIWNLACHSGEFVWGMSVLPYDSGGVSLGGDGECHLLDLKEGRVRRTMRVGPGVVRNLEVSARGDRALLGEVEGQLLMISLPELRTLESIRVGAGQVLEAKLHPRCPKCAVLTTDPYVRIVNLDDRTVLELNRKELVSSRGLAFDPEGSVLYVGCVSQAIVALDAETWDSRQVIRGVLGVVDESDPYEAIVVSPNGRFVWGVTRRGMLTVCDPARPTAMDAIRVDGSPTCLAVEGDRVWVGCNDSTIRIFRFRP